MDKFEQNLADLEFEFIDTLQLMCEIFDDHTIPPLPDWLEEALDWMSIR